MTRNRFACALFGCAVFAAARISHAELKFDLRATAVNGVPISGAKTPHEITGVSSGDVVSFDVYAVVHGTDSDLTNDRFRSATGSFKSTPVNGLPLLSGNLKLDIVRSAIDPITGEPTAPFGFDAPGSSIGTQQDLDADGDLDVGSNVAVEPESYWAVRHAVLGVEIGAAPPMGVRVGLGSFTVAGGAFGSSTLLNFFGRNVHTASLWRLDGNSRLTRTFDSPFENGIVVSTVPEPASIGALIGGCAIIAACRRERARRS